MRNKNKFVPELRFEGFTDDWNKQQLENLVDYKSSLKNRVKSTVYNENYNTPVLTSGKTFLLGYTNENFDIWKASEKPTILFDDFTTAIKYANFDFKTKSKAIMFLTKKEKNSIDLFFLYNLMKTIKFDIGNIHRYWWISEYSKINVLIPKIEEQEKISNFLSKVDKRIKLLEEIKDLKKQYKKGLLQQMFVSNSAGGGALNVPSLRFKWFKGDWKSVKLGDLCSIKTGKLNSGNADKNGKYSFFTCSSKEVLKINNYTHNTEALLVSGSGATLGFVRYYNGKFNVQQRVYVLDQFKDNVRFLKFLLDSKLPKRVEREVQTGTQPNISLSTIKDMEIKLPLIEEQNKISNFLTHVDNNYNKLDKELEELKQWKKSLLQKLFV